MKKGTKKAHPLPTKVVDEPCYKRPIHGFCYTHFNMKEEHLTDIEHHCCIAQNVYTANRIDHMLWFVLPTGDEIESM